MWFGIISDLFRFHFQIIRVTLLSNFLYNVLNLILHFLSMVFFLFSSFPYILQKQYYLRHEDFQLSKSGMEMVPNIRTVMYWFYLNLRFYYHPRIRVRNVFSHVCLCVCLSVHPSVRMSVFLYVLAISGWFAFHWNACLCYSSRQLNLSLMYITWKYLKPFLYNTY